MRLSPTKIAVFAATVVAWGAFLYLDSLWTDCLTQAVVEGRKTFGETYGPLSLFRPVAMYLALGLSLVSGGWLALSAKGQKP